MKNTTSPRWVTYAPPSHTKPLIDAVEKDILNLYKITLEVYNDFSLEARNKKIQLILNAELDDDAASQSDFDFLGNHFEIYSLISQLIKNALAQTLEGSIEIFIQNTADHFIIEVNDTGIGVHPDQKITFVETQYRGQTCKITYVQDPNTSLASIADQLHLFEAKLKIQVKEGQGMKRRLSVPKTVSNTNSAMTADYAVAY